jgi:replicative DNA helicase
MQSTGIPPHVNALVMYERLNRNLLKFGEAVYKACAKTTKDVKDFLEEKAIGLGNVTATHLHNVVNSSLKSVLDTMGLNIDFVQKVTEKTNTT